MAGEAQQLEWRNGKSLPASAGSVLASAMLCEMRNDLEEIRAGLQSSVEDVCRTLLGKPQVRKCAAWRGDRNNGSLAVAMQHGAKRGFWHDRASQAGGDLFDLVRHARGGDFAGALKCREHDPAGQEAQTLRVILFIGPEFAAEAERLPALEPDGSVAA